MPANESANTIRIVEYIHQLFPVIDEEDKWLRDELLDLLQETKYFQAANVREGSFVLTSPSAWRKQYNDRHRVCHNILIQRGLQSPFEQMFSRKTKYNPDKKKGGKKKKGGRRRI